MNKKKDAKAFFARWLYIRTGFTPNQAEFRQAVKPFLKGKLMLLRMKESPLRCEMLVLEEDDAK